MSMRFYKHQGNLSPNCQRHFPMMQLLDARALKEKVLQGGWCVRQFGLRFYNRRCCRHTCNLDRASCQMPGRPSLRGRPRCRPASAAAPDPRRPPRGWDPPVPNLAARTPHSRKPLQAAWILVRQPSQALRLMGHPVAQAVKVAMAGQIRNRTSSQ